jgi:8-oxo-dGTP pyrophosphatase MutT (NUDIX family)
VRPELGKKLIAATPINRLTSRVLLFDREDRILLFLTTAPDTSGVARWLTPGGGVDPGESHHQAAARELQEETGLVIPNLGEPVWSHDFVVVWDAADHDTGHAEFYTATVDTFVPSDLLWTDEERVDVLAHRWWSLAELAASTEPFEPAELVDLARNTLLGMNR